MNEKDYTRGWEAFYDAERLSNALAGLDEAELRGLVRALNYGDTVALKRDIASLREVLNPVLSEFKKD